MSSFEDGLWERLVEEHDAHLVSLGGTRRKGRPRGVLVGGSVAACAATVTVAVVLAAGATTGTSPAYALTDNPDGTVTVTISDLATAVPELNARFAQMGIDATVVPIEPGCTTNDPALFVNSQETMTTTLTLTPGHEYLAPGDTGVLAAEQLSDGEVALAVEAMKPPVPSCFSPVAYRLHVIGDGSGVRTVEATPVDPPTPATAADRSR